MNYFLKGAEENFTSAVTVVPRKREVGLGTTGTKKEKGEGCNCSFKWNFKEKKNSHFELSFDDSKNLKRP